MNLLNLPALRHAITSRCHSRRTFPNSRMFMIRFFCVSKVAPRLMRKTRISWLPWMAAAVSGAMASACIASISARASSRRVESSRELAKEAIIIGLAIVSTSTSRNLLFSLTCSSPTNVGYSSSQFIHRRISCGMFARWFGSAPCERRKVDTSRLPRKEERSSARSFRDRSCFKRTSVLLARSCCSQLSNKKEVTGKFPRMLLAMRARGTPLVSCWTRNLTQSACPPTAARASRGSSSCWFHSSCSDGKAVKTRDKPSSQPCSAAIRTANLTCTRNSAASASCLFPSSSSSPPPSACPPVLRSLLFRRLMREATSIRATPVHPRATLNERRSSCCSYIGSNALADQWMETRQGQNLCTSRSQTFS
mmetsp:Transcript_22670/g.51097  ORF Transcript_22670/g.51097 Transcript_22670/m.51097 type:complete len:365 (-) Transcript_22670:179-1273(-)